MTRIRADDTSPAVVGPFADKDITVRIKFDSVGHSAW